MTLSKVSRLLLKKTDALFDHHQMKVLATSQFTVKLHLHSLRIQICFENALLDIKN